MGLSDILARIEMRLAHLGLSSDKASKLAGKRDAIRNLKRAVESGRGGISTKTAEALASVLGVNPAWLLTGEGLEDASTIPLIGHTGLEGQPDLVILTGGSQRLPGHTAPPQVHYSTVAIEVRGNSIRNVAKPGSILFFEKRGIKRGPSAIGDLFGHLCICWLSDERVLLKEIREGKSPGYFNLLSENDDAMDDIMVDQAARVMFIAPRGMQPVTIDDAVDAPYLPGETASQSAKTLRFVKEE